MIDPRTGQPDASLTDLDGFIAAIESGHGRQGAAIGGVDDQPEVFRSEMLAFHDQLNG